jgi:Protein of unknown function (DUF3800)
MKIAIDESGDTGRKLWMGSSKWFVLAAAIVPEVADGCGTTCQVITKYQHQFMGGVELHFSHNSHSQHLHFLEYMKDKDYVFAAVAIDKRKLLTRRPQVLRSKMTLVQFAFDNLFTHLKPWLDQPIVLIDTNGPPYFNASLSRHLLKQYGMDHKGDYNSIQAVRAVDSRHEPLVQLADYVAGAVRHFVDDQYSSESYDKYLSTKGKIFYV